MCRADRRHSSPEGLAADTRGHLYVANSGASDIVEVDESTGQLVNTYADPGEAPEDVCVDNDTGDLAATNPQPGAGDIVLYTATSTSGPSGTASGTGYTSPSFCALDKQRHAIVFDDDESGGGEVGAVIPGNYTGAKKMIPLSTSNSIASGVGGIQVNSSNEITLGAPSSAGAVIYTYKRTGTTLTLAATTPLSGVNYPEGYAFNTDSTLVFTSINDYKGTVDAVLYRYPVGGPIEEDFFLPSFAVPFGAAINPTEQFVRR